MVECSFWRLPGQMFRRVSTAVMHLERPALQFTSHARANTVFVLNDSSSNDPCWSFWNIFHDSKLPSPAGWIARISRILVQALQAGKMNDAWRCCTISIGACSPGVHGIHLLLVSISISRKFFIKLLVLLCKIIKLPGSSNLSFTGQEPSRCYFRSWRHFLVSRFQDLRSHICSKTAPIWTGRILQIWWRKSNRFVWRWHLWGAQWQQLAAGAFSVVWLVWWTSHVHKQLGIRISFRRDQRKVMKRWLNVIQVGEWCKTYGTILLPMPTLTGAEGTSCRQTSLSSSVKYHWAKSRSRPKVLDSAYLKIHHLNSWWFMFSHWRSFSCFQANSPRKAQGAVFERCAERWMEWGDFFWQMLQIILVECECHF